MKNKATFLKNLSIVIVVALMGVLLIASYFIPIMKPSETYRVDGVNKNYSCRDVVVAMNADSLDDLSPAKMKHFLLYQRPKEKLDNSFALLEFWE